MVEVILNLLTVIFLLVILQANPSMSTELEEEIEIQDDIEAMGVTNLGTTCWLGAVLQMLYHTDLGQYIIDMNMEEVNNNDTFTAALKSILEEMKYGNESVSVTTLEVNIHDLIPSYINVNEAQDAFEIWTNSSKKKHCQKS